jgi:hypothetical protein
MLPYSAPEVARLEVIKPGGELMPVDVAANSKETIDDSQMSMNIYDPNSRVLQVNIPKVEIGDVVHSVTRMTTERAYIPGQFAEENVLEGDGLIRHLTYEVFAPADRPLQRTALRDEIPGTVIYSAQTNADGSVTHRWTAANVPRMFAEPSMPPYEMVLQRLYVSTLPDWQAVSKWYWDLSQPHLEATTPEMQATVSNLTADAHTEADKIKAVFYHVSKKIRYMGLTPDSNRMTWGLRLARNTACAATRRRCWWPCCARRDCARIPCSSAWAPNAIPKCRTPASTTPSWEWNWEREVIR